MELYNIKITIITPTYNRAHLLPRLYESLEAQTCQDFIWMIVDDGSVDGTGELVEGWLETISESATDRPCSISHNDDLPNDADRNAGIRIAYIHQINGGKHRALNNGISQIDTELTFIVDSDDYLPPDSIETILKYHAKYKEYSNPGEALCGYSFLRCHEDGSVNTAYFPSDELIGSYRDVRINGNIGGDKAEVYYTGILKQFPFPVFEGEKFLPEDIVWMQMSGPYDMVHINENVYTCEYLEGGLTTTGRKMKVNSPKGMRLRSLVYMHDSGVKLKTKVKMMILYIIYGKYIEVEENSDTNPGVDRYENLSRSVWFKLMYVLCFIPAQILSLRWGK